MQSALQVIFPPSCISCGASVARDFSLCGECWRETPFVSAGGCQKCGVPLAGDSDGDAMCDDCIRIARPWSKGRVALMYSANARKLVLGLKHGDKQELARPAAEWMAAAGRDLINPASVLVPVPLHWRRLLSRRFNQSALLANWLARITSVPVCVDALVRQRMTPTQDKRSVEDRFDNLRDAITPNPRRDGVLRGRSVILVDDVMTSGATFAAATEAAQAAGASEVSVLALARVAKDA